MSLSVGLVGLPNVGKSTLFNAMVQGSAAATNFPFCTIEPNMGVAEIPDERLTALRELIEPESFSPASIQFTDIAGLVQGASQGEGRGNQFLADVRETDALLHVVRCFDDPQVAHVEEGVDPLRDVAIIEAELILADLQSVEKSARALERIVHTDPRSARRLELETLQAVEAGLLDAQPAQRLTLSAEQLKSVKSYNLLTAKPMLYAANVGEDDTAGVAAQPLSGHVGADRVVTISARIEAEIAQLEDDERGEFLSELGLADRGIDRLIVAAYDLLDLITFYTHANSKLQAWQVRHGTLAPQAAGGIHSDMEEGFVRAEVASYADVEAAAGQQARLRDSGRLRTEGKDYVIADGDVVHFLFRK